jgi:hypothetical protein
MARGQSAHTERRCCLGNVALHSAGSRDGRPTSKACSSQSAWLGRRESQSGIEPHESKPSRVPSGPSAGLQPLQQAVPAAPSPPKPSPSGPTARTLRSNTPSPSGFPTETSTPSASPLSCEAAPATSSSSPSSSSPTALRPRHLERRLPPRHRRHRQRRRRRHHLRDRLLHQALPPLRRQGRQQQRHRPQPVLRYPSNRPTVGLRGRIWLPFRGLCSRRSSPRTARSVVARWGR